ncbi:MAG: PP2C family protein-serine/threonine phosphatase, partial [Acidimicrobiales bacterium]
LGVRLRVAWRTLVLAGVNLAHTFTTLQDLLVSERPTAEIFVTVCEVAVAPDRRTAEMCLAGHPAPVVVSGGRVMTPPAPTGPPLGVVDDATWATATLDLEASWTLLLYTDGLVENVSPDMPERRRLGTEGLFEVVRESVGRGDTIQRIVQETLLALQEARPGALTDDVAIVAISPLAPS